MEAKLLGAALNSRKDYAQLEKHIDKNDLTPEGKIIYDGITKYYSTDPEAKLVDRELLCKFFERELKSAKVVALVTNTVKSLPSEVSSPNILKDLKDNKLYVLGSKIGSLLGSGSNPGELARLMGAYRDLEATDLSDEGEVGEEEFNSVDITTLVKSKFDKSNLIEIWPPVLNEQIDGGARRGHHILIFAPVEMGKTLMAVNMVAGFLKQNLKVLYVGNEDPAADILMRVACRLTGMNKHEIMERPEEANKLLTQRNWDKFTLVAMAPGSFDRINDMCVSGGYDVVVLDQLRNLDVRGAGNRTETLERAATEARNLARKHSVLVVSVTQAADSASGKRILTRGDVDSSNVGIPAQCDLMIGLGAEQSMEDANMRCISLPKNKLSGNHAPIMVQVDPTISKVLT